MCASTYDILLIQAIVLPLRELGGLVCAPISCVQVPKTVFACSDNCAIERPSLLRAILETLVQ
jgi:hypothetical protein